ncbi:hypothetical protein [Sphingomonas sp. PAMC 26605]|uniref:hypothetical protein n=1 Tax=Sphingomonas sp. PAMC 26605 TaxID=1112214 RepID=UPI000311BF4F|nr:hypothetical protein [Sphingomonas sp. PAMC 26605]
MEGTLPPQMPARTALPDWSSCTLRFGGALFLTALGSVSGGISMPSWATGQAAAQQRTNTDKELAIEPMTSIDGNGSGYFADPQPIHLASSERSVQLLSGTTKAILACRYPTRPGCFSWKPITIDAGSLRPMIAAAGATVTNFQNLDLYQDDDGGWHAAVTIGVRSAAHPKHWTVIAHAHPTSPALPGSAPTTWSADVVLGGSFSKPVEGNYDAKYFEDNGRLYMLYVDAIATPPALRNAIFLQPMLSPTRLAPTRRFALLAPEDRANGRELASELYGNTQARLVEAPYISRIGGKYALIYSSGAYLTTGYKAGIAWSDTLLPSAGGSYRKVFAADSGGIWGERGKREVRYLVQSARLLWPNFTGVQVIGPGVAAAVHGPDGAWLLYFNGFAPGDMPLGQNGRVAGNHRRPYYLRLDVNVPADRSVSSASDSELASWVVPEAR